MYGHMKKWEKNTGSYVIYWMIQKVKPQNITL